MCGVVEEGLEGRRETLMCCGCQNLAVRAKAVCFHVDLDSLTVTKCKQNGKLTHVGWLSVMKHGALVCFKCEKALLHRFSSSHRIPYSFVHEYK